MTVQFDSCAWFSRARCACSGAACAGRGRRRPTADGGARPHPAQQGYHFFDGMPEDFRDSGRRKKKTKYIGTSIIIVAKCDIIHFLSNQVGTSKDYCIPISAKFAMIFCTENNDRSLFILLCRGYYVGTGEIWEHKNMQIYTHLVGTSR